MIDHNVIVARYLPVLNEELCVHNTTVKAGLPRQCDKVVPDVRRYQVFRFLRCSLGLQFDFSRNRAELVDNFTIVLAIVLHLDVRHFQYTSVHIVLIDARVNLIMSLRRHLQRGTATLKVPLEFGLGVGLYLAEDLGRLVQIIGNLVVLV